MNSSSAPGLFLSDHIDPGAVRLALGSPHADGVLGELVDLIPELRNRTDARVTLLRALQERESLHSTGIGDGIALPHARNAMVGLVERPAITFGRHPTGIPYGAIDGEPVRIFFLLVATTVTQHLQFLARLSRMLRDPRFRQRLLTVNTPAELIASVGEAEARF